MSDYNTLLNKGLDQNIFPRLGQYAVRYSVASDSALPPFGCSVTVVNSLERHGARLFTSNALANANATFVKIQSSLSDVNASTLPTELQFFKNTDLQGGTDSLLPYGALQAYYSGKSTAQVYPLLSHLPPFVRASGDEASLDDRVILTAKYWRLGYTGGQFPSTSLKTSDDVRAAAASSIEPDVIFSEATGANNTLDVSTCTNANNIPSSQGEKGAQQAFATSAILPTVGARLTGRLHSAGAKGLTLTGTDLINLAELCSFDTFTRASVSNGQLSLLQSNFCNVFNQTEWTILGYAFDVGKWNGAGYGNSYYKSLGTGFLRELTARFSGQAPLLSEPTSLNTTDDGNNKTFPLPNAHGQPVVFFDGSHDNNIGPIVAAAGLFSGPNLTTSRDAQDAPYNWIFSHIAPLQGKIVFEKLTCGLPFTPFSKEFVRIRANEAVLTGWCGDGSHYAQDTLCPLESFLKNIAFAESATEWNKCYQ
ncbi:hypothetical protein CBS101457_004362 [Exobasidium rhododendri]|nr:hypothetical protein CBS101457_004362 [Exobasidium rhododendri]